MELEDADQKFVINIGETEVEQQKPSLYASDCSASLSIESPLKLKGRERAEAKRAIRLTRSGRQVKPSLKSLSSNYEEEPQKKSLGEIYAELERLRKLAAERWPEAYKKYRNRVSKIFASPEVATTADNQNNCKTRVMVTTEEQTETSTKETPFPKEKTDDACNILKGLEYISANNLNKDVLRILESLQTLEDQKKLVIEQNNTIINRNIQIMALLKNEPGKSINKPIKGFPLKTLEEFYRFSEEDNKELVKNMHQRLIHIRGDKLRSYLYNVVKMLMTDDLVAKFSWVGCNTYEKFGDTKMANLLYLSAVKCQSFRGPTTMWEFRNEMQEVFRAIKQRQKNKSRKYKNDRLLAKIARLQKLQEELEDKNINNSADDSSLASTYTDS